MSKQSGFVWYELMTTDTRAAADFYGRVVGWTTADQPGSAYKVFSTREGGVAGLLDMPEDARRGGATPVWMGYISVDDVDDYARRFEASGGSIHRPPADIPGVGRFAMVSDPQGAMLALFKSLPTQGGGPPALDSPGYPAWRELMTTDGPAAFDFYAGMFGWDRSSSHDMGSMGVYQLFSYDGRDRGGIMTRPPAIERSYWGYVFQVDAIGAAVERLKASGGAVTNGPHQVPTGDWIVKALDPQGAEFTVISPRP